MIQSRRYFCEIFYFQTLKKYIFKGGKATKVEEGAEVRGKKNRKKKKKQTVLKNFYAHQMKDEKIHHIQDLRKKFEEDKQKIAKMKADRKFRPF